ncbi:hypothetical protein Cgig2_022262 [Carnegiea gigantea]|uniref:BHLH domain-containing protein n=1 Tax=Carnegiea gigantea TaxID=171969 RepID=A0A9Q1KHE6_9CARY|nr:hypothetical protein Cgig2_022262 [Carnegiea gigantea]
MTGGVPTKPQLCCSAKPMLKWVFVIHFWVYSEQFPDGEDYLQNGELGRMNTEDSTPFLQMLQSVESQIPFPYPLIQEPNFQLLLRLQHRKLMMQPLEEDQIVSSVTNNDIVMESGSCRTENPVSEINQRTSRRGRSSSKRNVGPNKERRKRKRLSARPMKNKEEVESQRMTHIAVERNRRRQMSEHLNVLRSLMPPSYVQRGDQASIIGGALDYVKELEHLLQSLQARKRMRQLLNENGGVSASSSSSSANLLGILLMETSSSSPSSSAFHFRYSDNEDLNAEIKSGLAEIQVAVIQNHVNLKIQCQRRSGQLLKAIFGLENLGLSVLLLNISSLHSFVHFSFNLKIEDNCNLRSAEEVASAVHQIFTLINAS